MADYLTVIVGTSDSDLRLLVAHYAWLLVPAAIGLAIVVVVMFKVLPRQRRREDLSGQERRFR